MHRRLIIVAQLDPDISRIRRAAVHEGEVVIVFGRVDIHSIRKTLQNEREHGHRIVHGERRRLRHLLHVSLVGMKFWRSFVLTRCRADRDGEHRERREKAGSTRPLRIKAEAAQHFVHHITSRASLSTVNLIVLDSQTSTIHVRMLQEYKYRRYKRKRRERGAATLPSRAILCSPQQRRETSRRTGVSYA